MHPIPKSLQKKSGELNLPPLSFQGVSLVFRSPETPWQPAQKCRVPVEEFRADAKGFHAEVACPGGGTVGMRLAAEVTDDAVIWTLHITHRGTGWTLEEVEGPVLFVEKSEGFDLLLPDGLGTRTAEPSDMAPVELHYPSGRCTMAWSAFAGKNSGWYLGRHDEAFSQLWWRVRGTGGGTEWTLSQKPWIKPGGSWTSSPIVLRAYAGPWQEAARTYRHWADTWFSRKSLPVWPSEQTGWMLAILKQQNGEIYWNYRELGRVWELAREHGLSAVGLFGWAHGGHDRYYPEYYPDPAMGGEEELRKALAAARRLGLRTILYANGQLMDTATEFYRWHGNDACSWQANHEPHVQSIRKFNSSTPVTFALGCHGAPVWQGKMRSLALAAERLGADGILFDQVGVAGAVECHNPAHAHAHPGTGWAEERVAFYAKLCAELRAINPAFAIMTEGIFDALGAHMAWFHGWGTGFAPKPIYEFLGDGESDFPGLFRTAFPEVPLIQRFSTPVLGRAEANHAILHGLSHEIESRWPADLRYLEYNEAPTNDAYADCTYYPPDVKLMQSVTSQEGRAYLRLLCEFASAHADLLRHGTYIGDEEVAGTGILNATARIAGKHAGVIVVNPGAELVTVQPTFRSLPAISAHEPESDAVDPASPVPPCSVRLYRYDISQ